VSSRHARAAATAAEAARLGAAALVQPQADTALLLARQAVALAATPTTEGALLEALGRYGGLVGVVDPGAAQFNGYPFESDDLVSADGTRVLMNGSNGVDLVDTSTGHFVGGGPLEPQPADSGTGPLPVGFIDGGRTALVAVQTSSAVPSRSIQAFNASDGHPIGAPQLVPDSVSGYVTEMDRVRISPDGRTLVSILDRAVRVWKRSTTTSAWGPLVQFALPALPPSIPDDDLVLSATFSTDSSRVALLLSLAGPPYGQPPNVGIVVDTDAEQVQLPLVIPQSGATPEVFAISPAGDRLAIGYQDGSVELRSTSDANSVVRIPGTSEATALGWSADGARLVVGHEDGGLDVFNTDPLQAVASYPAGGPEVQVAALRGDRLISQDSSQAITVRALADTYGFLRETPIEPANSIAAGPPGTVVAVGDAAGKVVLYSQKTLAALPLHLSLGPYPELDTTAAPDEHERVSALAITPDGSALIAADRVGHLRMWSLPDGRLLWSRDDVPTSFLAISPNGRYLATSGFKQAPNDQDPDSYPVQTQLTVWDLATTQPVFTDNLPGVTDNDYATPKPRAVLFSPDSKMLAAAFFEETLVFTNFVDHARQVIITPQSAPNNSAIGFSPDGKELFVQDFNGKVTGFDPQTGRSIATFPAPASGYSHLLFTADGKWLVGSDTTAIYVWDGRTRQLVVSQLSLPSNGATDALALAATTDHRLFVGTQTSLVAIDMDPSTWESQACGMAGRTLTRAEWTQFLPGRPYAPACG
jgi:WD40 repeat protein